LLYVSKLEVACKSACKIRKLHATSIVFFNTAGITFSQILKETKASKFCKSSAVFLLIKGNPTIPTAHFQAYLNWCDGTFKLIAMK